MELSLMVCEMHLGGNCEELRERDLFLFKLDASQLGVQSPMLGAHPPSLLQLLS